VEQAQVSQTPAQKKSERAAEQDRSDVAQARDEWRASQSELNPERLVFIDETGAATDMARRYGRCPRGQRLVSSVPWGHWKTTTFVGALSVGQIRRALRVRRTDWMGRAFAAMSSSSWSRSCRGQVAQLGAGR
jgi:hypothetical protein